MINGSKLSILAAVNLFHGLDQIGDLKQELALARKNELFLESKHKKMASRYGQ